MLNAPSYRDYAAGFVKFSEGFIEPPVRSIPKLVEFNIEHAERAMPHDNPGQDFLEKTAANMDALMTEQYDKYQKTLLNHEKDVGIVQLWKCTTSMSSWVRLPDDPRPSTTSLAIRSE